MGAFADTLLRRNSEVMYFAATEATPATPVVNTEGHLIPGLRVFKTGTFKNSAGEEKTWSRADLEKMVQNFNSLRSGGQLPNVPVRADHSWSIAAVVGYINSLSIGQDDVLLADVELTEPDAVDKWNRKTFRSRSLEVGEYEANDGTKFHPVVLGLAFVDLPAVEGLYSSANRGERYEHKETGVPETFRPENQPHTFRINGLDSVDPAAVQAHIDTLETFQRDTVTVTREAFVAKLAAENKITAGQVESFTKHVGSLTPDQYEEFTKAWESAAPSHVLGEHGTQPTPKPNTGAPDEVTNLKKTVDMHRKSGLSQEDIEKTPTWKRLTALGQTA